MIVEAMLTLKGARPQPNDHKLHHRPDQIAQQLSMVMKDVLLTETVTSMTRGGHLILTIKLKHNLDVRRLTLLKMSKGFVLIINYF